MPRYSRKALCGNFFHVIVQGLNKEFIFYKDEYKEKYKNLLEEESKKNDINIIAYCIMNNHTHILMFVKNIESMSECMHCINTSYARFYNKKEERVGFVFRDRFYTQPIKNEIHLLNCIAYIHKNPVKAGIASQEGSYEYSSYNEYVNTAKRKLITDESIKLAFGTCDNLKFKDTFDLIHKTKVEDDFLEIDDDIDYNQIIKEYNRENCSIDEIIIKLYKIHKMSTRDIAELLKITRYRVRKAIETMTN